MTSLQLAVLECAVGVVGGLVVGWTAGQEYAWSKAIDNYERYPRTQKEEKVRRWSFLSFLTGVVSVLILQWAKSRLSRKEFNEAKKWFGEAQKES